MQDDFERIQRELAYLKLQDDLRQWAALSPTDSLAAKLERMQAIQKNPDLSIDTAWLAGKLPREIRQRSGGCPVWSEEQNRLLRDSAREKVSVIVGGSGTGKTMVTYALLAMYRAFGMSCRVIAPTDHMIRSLSSDAVLFPSEEERKRADSVTGALRKQNPGSFDVYVFPDFFKAETEKLRYLLQQIPESSRLLLVGNPADLPVRSRNDWLESGESWVHRLTLSWYRERRPGEYITEEELLARIERSKFRRAFTLKEKDREYIRARGWQVVEAHARERVEKYLAPAYVEKDGQQTPLRGHPMFPAQHAVACCCRGCLYRWYRIPKGRELTEEEQEYVVSLMMTWMRWQMEG